MSGVHVRKLVVAMAIVLFDALCRALKHFFCLAPEIGQTPAMMQGFESQILVADLSADGHQLVASQLGLVEPLIPRRVQIQSPGRLK
jgi:hypothetical protein